MAIWYTKTHQWYNDETGEVGLTPFAAEQLGEISFVVMPPAVIIASLKCR